MDCYNKDTEKSMKTITLAQCLEKYSLESLKSYCDEYVVPFRNEKQQVCMTLANKLNEEHVILQRLGILEDHVIDGLMKLNKEEEIVDEDVIDHLDGLDLIAYDEEEEKWFIVEETKQALMGIDESWHKLRRSRVWLMQCLVVVQHEWADVPMAVMEELYLKKDGVDPDADLKKLFYEIPVSETTCVVIGENFVIRGWRSSEVFAISRDRQKQYDFYIPSVEEVIDLYRNDYDTLDPNGIEIQNWFLKNGADQDDLQLLLHELWNDMNYGHTEISVLQEAESMISYDNDEEKEDFRKKMHQWFVHTRRLDYRGHNEVEVEVAKCK